MCTVKNVKRHETKTSLPPLSSTIKFEYFRKLSGNGVKREMCNSSHVYRHKVAKWKIQHFINHRLHSVSRALSLSPSSPLLCGLGMFRLHEMRTTTPQKQWKREEEFEMYFLVSFLSVFGVHLHQRRKNGSNYQEIALFSWCIHQIKKMCTRK